jgi:hypothetical protein
MYQLIAGACRSNSAPKQSGALSERVISAASSPASGPAAPYPSSASSQVLQRHPHLLSPDEAIPAPCLPPEAPADMGRASRA